MQRELTAFLYTHTRTHRRTGKNNRVAFMASRMIYNIVIGRTWTCATPKTIPSCDKSKIVHSGLIKPRLNGSSVMIVVTNDASSEWIDVTQLSMQAH